jgi:hypothetical protein
MVTNGARHSVKFFILPIQPNHGRSAEVVIDQNSVARRFSFSVPQILKDGD